MMMRSNVALLAPLLVVACSFAWDSHDPRGAGSGAAGGEGGGGGVGAAGGAGGGSGGAAMPIASQPVAALAGEFDDDDPTTTADELELYFNTSRSGAYDIWLSQRADRSDPWGDPAPVSGFNSSAQETNGVVSADGLSFWVSSRRDGQDNLDVYVSTRASRTDAWPTVTLVSELSHVTLSDTVCTVSDDGLTMAFGRSNDLFSVTRPSDTEPWGTPAPLDGINSAAFDGDAWMSDDQLAILFSTTRNGSWDIFRAERNTTSSPWTDPEPVAGLVSAGHESDPWLGAPNASNRTSVLFARGSSDASRQIHEALLP
jgi:hypothetical protein